MSVEEKIGEIHANVCNLKENMGVVRSDVTAIFCRLNDLKDDVANVKVTQVTIEKNVNDRIYQAEKGSAKEASSLNVQIAKVATLISIIISLTVAVAVAMVSEKIEDKHAPTTMAPDR